MRGSHWFELKVEAEVNLVKTNKWNFEWLLQLRFYFEQGTERCVVRQ